jgi:Arc/MetJ family transcription regulator
MMPRTTLAIDDDLLDELKARALKERRTVQAVTNTLLRSALRASDHGKGYRLEPVAGVGKLRKNVRLEDRAALFDLMDSSD